MFEQTLSLRLRLALLSLQILALSPVWSWYLARMSDGSDEPWGVFALGAVLLLLVREHRQGLSATEPACLLAATVLMLVYALTLPMLSPLPRAALGISGLAAGIFALLPATGPRLALLGLLLLSLPVISSLQFYLGYPLRLLTAWGSVGLLHGVGLPVQQLGTEMQWQDRTVMVDAPCSGVHMLWVGLVFSGLVSYVRRATEWRTLLNAGSSLGVILGANVLRATLLFFKEAELVSAPEWSHSALGVAVFALSVLTILALSREPRHAL